MSLYNTRSLKYVNKKVFFGHEVMRNRLNHFRISMIQSPFLRITSQPEISAIGQALAREIGCDIKSIETAKTPDNFLCFFVSAPCAIYAGLVSVRNIATNTTLSYRIEPLKISNMHGIYYPDCDRLPSVTNEKCKELNFYHKVNNSDHTKIKVDSFNEKILRLIA